MKPLRRLFRRLYYDVLFARLKRRFPNLAFGSGRQSGETAFPATTLRIVAAGTSVRKPVGDIFAADGQDILGINYLIANAAIPAWQHADLFVIEPHDDFEPYVEAAKRAAEAKGSIRILVKGIGSPGKRDASLRLIGALSHVKGATVVPWRDLYLPDLPQASFAKAIAAHPDQTVSGSKTVLWALSYGYVAGYRKIVLHGFDFSADYAYETDGDAAPPPNTWVDDPRRRDVVLDEIVATANALSRKGVAIMQCNCDGPLAQLLPADPDCE